MPMSIDWFNKFANAEANYLVSRDKDLLVLKEFRGVKIVKPEQFMKLYKQGR
jgi:predicted nucleic acid-binding protein